MKPLQENINSEKYLCLCDEPVYSEKVGYYFGYIIDPYLIVYRHIDDANNYCKDDNVVVEKMSNEIQWYR